MSFSFPTSHLKAAPPIGVATTRAPSGSISATTTLAAPARWKASHIARPMPLAPPVTTTTLPATCMITLRLSKKISAQNDVEHGGIVAGRAGQHEAMPDHVLETQPPPGVENDPQAVEYSARDQEGQRHGRQ